MPAQNTVAHDLPDAAARAFMDQVIAKRGKRPGSLLGILEAVQEHDGHKHLSLGALRYVAERTHVPLARIYSVATFYSLFNLQPQGDNTICICRGTACHTRGSRKLLESLRLELGLNDAGHLGEADKLSVTTPDGKFTIRTVACFGQCALAPVAEVNHRICGHVNERTLEREVQALEREHR